MATVSTGIDVDVYCDECGGYVENVLCDKCLASVDKEPVIASAVEIVNAYNNWLGSGAPISMRLLVSKLARALHFAGHIDYALYSEVAPYAMSRATGE
jgi:hypothetical protein